MKSCIRAVFVFVLIVFTVGGLEAQNREDTLLNKKVDSVIVSTYISNTKLKYLPDVEGVNIYAGKKTNIVYNP